MNVYDQLVQMRDGWRKNKMIWVCCSVCGRTFLSLDDLNKHQDYSGHGANDD
jgi:hypothetical protein